MKTIYKYELNLYYITALNLPIGAKILTVQIQFDKICIWALVDPTNKVESRLFVVVGTGQMFNEKEVKQYLGTVQQNKGQYIWHVFEING